MADRLHGFARVVRANARRRTRFHTERGDLVPLSQLPDLAESVARRICRVTSPGTPWMVASVVADLEHRVTADATILEVGAGDSTVWWAQRARHVTSLEASSAWAAHVRAQVAHAKLANVSVVEVAVAETLATLAQFSEATFDVVVVDCPEVHGTSRLDVLMASDRLVAGGGCLILDDSDRRHLWSADSYLAGWTRRRYIGVKPTPLMAVETTIYQKPGSLA